MLLPATDEQKKKIREYIATGKLDAKYESKVDGATYTNAARLIDAVEAEIAKMQGGA